MDIIKALADPHILASVIRDPTTWTVWLVYLKALFALPMDEAEATTVPRMHGPQRRCPPWLSEWLG